MTAAADRQTVRVLLVDDDARFAAVVQAALEDDGYDVVGTVGVAAEVSDAVASTTPDVVVLDLILPDGDGLAVADELRGGGHAVPIVLFSSLFDRRIGRATLESGYGYVEKAAGVEALELAIDAAISTAG